MLVIFLDFLRHEINCFYRSSNFLAHKMKTKLKIFNTGMIDISPLLIPVIPFGIIFGVLGMELGLGPYLTCAISIIICGGASQIVLIQLPDY